MSNEKTNVQSERKDYPILEKMKNLPGGLVIIPLVIAVVIATFIPQFFQIGGYVTALFYEGNACMMGFFLIVCGSMIDVKQVGLSFFGSSKLIMKKNSTAEMLWVLQSVQQL